MNHWGAAVSELGWLNTIFYAVSRALQVLPVTVNLHKYYLVAQRVSEESSLPSRRGRSICMRRVHEGDPVIGAFPVPAEVIRSRYAQGAVCLAAFGGDELIAYIWLLMGAYQEDEVRCRFIPRPAGRSAWDFDVYVVPKHRFGAAFLRLWQEANAYLSERGIEWTMSRISAFNSSSLASHRRLGARSIGSAVFVSLGSCQLTFATVTPFVHVSIDRNKGPQIKVHPPKMAGVLRETKVERSRS